MPITWEQVQELAGAGSVGRPHIGRALVAQGVVPDVNAAFAEHLSSRSKYYVPKADSDVFDTVALINAAGGLAVFAHPLARARGPVVGDEVITELAAAGLTGIEIDHPDQTDDDREHLRELATNLDLIGTGSSDYHGTNKSTRIGACTTDRSALEALLGHPTALDPVRRG